MFNLTNLHTHTIIGIFATRCLVIHLAKLCVFHRPKIVLELQNLAYGPMTLYSSAVGETCL